MHPIAVGDENVERVSFKSGGRDWLWSIQTQVIQPFFRVVASAFWPGHVSELGSGFSLVCTREGRISTVALGARAPGKFYFKTRSFCFRRYKSRGIV